LLLKHPILRDPAGLLLIVLLWRTFPNFARYPHSQKPPCWWVPVTVCSTAS